MADSCIVYVNRRRVVYVKTCFKDSLNCKTGFRDKFSKSLRFVTGCDCDD